MPSCSVFGCENNTFYPKVDDKGAVIKVTYHSFPLRNPPLLAQWLKNLNRGRVWKPKVHHKMCSDHFKKKCFTPLTNRRLLPDAVPTIFPKTKARTRGKPRFLKVSTTSPTAPLVRADSTEPVASVDTNLKEVVEIDAPINSTVAAETVSTVCGNKKNVETALKITKNHQKARKYNTFSIPVSSLVENIVNKCLQEKVDSPPLDHNVEKSVNVVYNTNSLVALKLDKTISKESNNEQPLTNVPNLTENLMVSSSLPPPKSSTGSGQEFWRPMMSDISAKQRPSMTETGVLTTKGNDCQDNNSIKLTNHNDTLTELKMRFRRNGFTVLHPVLKPLKLVQTSTSLASTEKDKEKASPIETAFKSSLCKGSSIKTQENPANSEPNLSPLKVTMTKTLQETLSQTTSKNAREEDKIIKEFEKNKCLIPNNIASINTEYDDKITLLVDRSEKAIIDKLARLYKSNVVDTSSRIKEKITTPKIIPKNGTSVSYRTQVPSKHDKTLIPENVMVCESDAKLITKHLRVSLKRIEVSSPILVSEIPGYLNEEKEQKKQEYSHVEVLEGNIESYLQPSGGKSTPDVFEKSKSTVDDTHRAGLFSTNNSPCLDVGCFTRAEIIKSQEKPAEPRQETVELLKKLGYYQSSNETYVKTARPKKTDEEHTTVQEPTLISNTTEDTVKSSSSTNLSAVEDQVKTSKSLLTKPPFVPCKMSTRSTQTTDLKSRKSSQENNKVDVESLKGTSNQINQGQKKTNSLSPPSKETPDLTERLNKCEAGAEMLQLRSKRITEKCKLLDSVLQKSSPPKNCKEACTMQSQNQNSSTKKREKSAPEVNMIENCITEGDVHENTTLEMETNENSTTENIDTNDTEPIDSKESVFPSGLQPFTAPKLKDYSIMNIISNAELKLCCDKSIYYLKNNPQEIAAGNVNIDDGDDDVTEVICDVTPVGEDFLRNFHIADVSSTDEDVNCVISDVFSIGEASNDEYVDEVCPVKNDDINNSSQQKIKFNMVINKRVYRSQKALKAQIFEKAIENLTSNIPILSCLKGSRKKYYESIKLSIDLKTESINTSLQQDSQNIENNIKKEIFESNLEIKKENLMDIDENCVFADLISTSDDSNTAVQNLPAVKHGEEISVAIDPNVSSNETVQKIEHNKEISNQTTPISTTCETQKETQDAVKSKLRTVRLLDFPRKQVTKRIPSAPVINKNNINPRFLQLSSKSKLDPSKKVVLLKPKLTTILSTTNIGNVSSSLTEKNIEYSKTLGKIEPKISTQEAIPVIPKMLQLQNVMSKNVAQNPELTNISVMKTISAIPKTYAMKKKSSNEVSADLVTLPTPDITEENILHAAPKMAETNSTALQRTIVSTDKVISATREVNGVDVMLNKITEILEEEQAMDPPNLASKTSATKSSTGIAKTSVSNDFTEIKQKERKENEKQKREAKQLENETIIPIQDIKIKQETVRPKIIEFIDLCDTSDIEIITIKRKSSVVHTRQKLNKTSNSEESSSPSKQSIAEKPIEIIIDETPVTEPSTLVLDNIPVTEPSTLILDNIPVTEPSTLVLDEIPATEPSTLMLDKIPAIAPSTLVLDEIPAIAPSTLVLDNIPVTEPSTLELNTSTAELEASTTAIESTNDIQTPNSEDREVKSLKVQPSQTRIPPKVNQNKEIKQPVIRKSLRINKGCQKRQKLQDLNLEPSETVPKETDAMTLFFNSIKLRRMSPSKPLGTNEATSQNNADTTSAKPHSKSMSPEKEDVENIVWRTIPHRSYSRQQNYVKKTAVKAASLTEAKINSEPSGNLENTSVSTSIAEDLPLSAEKPPSHEFVENVPESETPVRYSPIKPSTPPKELELEKSGMIENNTKEKSPEKTSTVQSTSTAQSPSVIDISTEQSPVRIDNISTEQSPSIIDNISTEQSLVMDTTEEDSTVIPYLGEEIIVVTEALSSVIHPRCNSNLQASANYSTNSEVLLESPHRISTKLKKKQVFSTTRLAERDASANVGASSEHNCAFGDSSCWTNLFKYVKRSGEQNAEKKSVARAEMCESLRKPKAATKMTKKSEQAKQQEWRELEKAAKNKKRAAVIAAGYMIETTSSLITPPRTDQLIASVPRIEVSADFDWQECIPCPKESALRLLTTRKTNRHSFKLLTPNKSSHPTSTVTSDQAPCSNEMTDSTFGGPIQVVATPTVPRQPNILKMPCNTAKKPFIVNLSAIANIRNNEAIYVTKPLTSITSFKKILPKTAVLKVAEPRTCLSTEPILCKKLPDNLEAGGTAAGDSTAEVTPDPSLDLMQLEPPASKKPRLDSEQEMLVQNLPPSPPSTSTHIMEVFDAPKVASPSPEQQMPETSGGESHHPTSTLAEVSDQDCEKLKKFLPPETQTSSSVSSKDVLATAWYAELVKMLLVLQATKRGQRFSVNDWCENIIFRYEDDEEGWVNLCIKVKYFTNVKDNNFKLSNYICWSLLEHRKLFSNPHNEKIRCILYTNAEMNLNDDICGVPILPTSLTDLNEPNFVINPLKVISDDNIKISLMKNDFSNVEIDKFCQDFVIALTQPDISKLKKIIKNFIRDVFDCQTFECKKYFAKIKHFITSNSTIDHTTFEKFFKAQEQKINEGINNVPRKSVSNFFDRKNELELISECTKSPKQCQIDVVVSGIPGVGKTELVLQFIQQHPTKFDHILWINADNESSLELEFLKIAEKLKLITKSPTEYIKCENKNVNIIVSKIYKLLDSFKCLIIFDGANKTSDINNYLPVKGVEENNNIFYIVTSRVTEWECTLHIPLACVAPNVSQKFLLQNVPGNSSEEIKKLASILGHHPLALQLVVLYIRRQTKIMKFKGEKYKINDFIEAYKKSPDFFLDYKVTKDELPYNNSLTSIWDTDLASVADTENGVLSIKILKLMSYIESENIPCTLFQKLKEIQNSDDYYDVLLVLENKSIIKCENKNMSIHCLLQDVVRKKCVDDVPTLIEVLATFLDIVGDREVVDVELLPHIIKAWSFTVNHENIAKQFKKLPVKIINSEISNVKLEQFIIKNFPTFNNTFELDYEDLLKVQCKYIEVLFNLHNYNKIIIICDTMESTLPDYLTTHDLVLKMLFYKAQAICNVGDPDDSWSIFEDVYIKQHEKNLDFHCHDDWITLKAMFYMACRFKNHEALNACILSVQSNVLEIGGSTAYKRFLWYIRSIAKIIVTEWNLKYAIELYDKIFAVQNEKLEVDHVNTLYTLLEMSALFYSQFKLQDSYKIISKLMLKIDSQTDLELTENITELMFDIVYKLYHLKSMNDELPKFIMLLKQKVSNPNAIVEKVLLNISQKCSEQYELMLLYDETYTLHCIGTNSLYVLICKGQSLKRSYELLEAYDIFKLVYNAEKSDVKIINKALTLMCETACEIDSNGNPIPLNDCCLAIVNILGNHYKNQNVFLHTINIVTSYLLFSNKSDKALKLFTSAHQSLRIKFGESDVHTIWMVTEEAKFLCTIHKLEEAWQVLCKFCNVVVEKPESTELMCKLIDNIRESLEKVKESDLVCS